MGVSLKGVIKGIGKGVTGAAHAVGNTLNNKYVKGALAAGLAATGVGAIPAAAIMGGTGLASGALRSGGGLKGALTGAGQGALTGGIASGVGSGARSLAGMLHGGGGSPSGTGEEPQYDDSGAPVNDAARAEVAGASPGGGGGYSISSILGKAGGALGGLAGKAGGFLTGNNGMNALGVAQGVNAAMQQKAAMDAAKRAVGTAEGAYNERAPLRLAGIEGLLHPKTPDLSQIPNRNPYGKPPMALKSMVA